MAKYLKENVEGEKQIMKRKVLNFLFVMAMGMLLLVGCGEKTKESADSVNGAVEESNENEITTDNTTEAAGEENPFEDYTFSLCWDEDLKQSAVVSYNPEKVKLTDLSYNAANFRWLDRTSVELLLMCEYENPSVEDLYEKKMKIHEGDDMSVSKLTEKQIGDYTVLRGDAVWNHDGTVGFEFFALPLENDMILYTVHLPGFENQVYLDEMLPYVLANVTTGDGTWIRPEPYNPDAEMEEETPDGIEWATYFEVTSFGGVKVKVYYDPDVIKSYSVYDPEFYLKDADGNEHMFAIYDYATAEEHRQAREEYFNQQKMLDEVSVSELMEYQAGEYTIKSFIASYLMYSYDGSGEQYTASTQEAIIELGLGVVCVFDETYMNEHPEFGTFLNSMKFVCDSGEQPEEQTEDLMEKDVIEETARDVKQSESAGNTGNFDAETKAVTSGGKTVKISYDSNVIASLDAIDGSMLRAYDMEVNRGIFSVSDFASAEDYRKHLIEFYGENSQVTEIEKNQVGGYTVHSFQVSYKHGDIKYGAIELGSGVIFCFDYEHTDEEVNLEEMLKAMRFEVE